MVRRAGGWGRGLGLLLALVALAGLGGPAWAQVESGTLAVKAVDESGAPVPGASVTVRSVESGRERVQTTDAAGVARFVALPPGSYRVQCDLTGFATLVQESVPLRVGQSVAFDLTLKVASMAETVTVSADVPLVDLYKTDSSTNITPEQIQELPVADRDFQRLAFITPGVQRERGGFRFIGGGPVIGAGGNASQSTILVDGVDLTDPALGLARARFSQDAIREFRVIANRFDTEIGNSAGGALSIVTKSGTNQLSGHRLRLLPRRLAARPGRARDRTRPTTRASSTASRSAARSSRTRPTSSSRSSTSARTTSSCSGRAAPTPRWPTTSPCRSTRPWPSPASTTRSRTPSSSRSSSSTSATARRTSGSAASPTSRTASSSTATTGT